jgi:histidinol-phosphatase
VAVSTDLEDRLAFALELARAAEQTILPLYRGCAITIKPDGTEVTEADRGAEVVLRQRIGSRFPGESILGEELGGELQREGRQWILDPIDGTAWFTVGLPLFGTLIACVEDGEPIVGVMHFPAMQETVYAARGLGCWFRAADCAPARVTVAPPVKLGDAVISASGIQRSDMAPVAVEQPLRLKALARQARKFRFCGDCSQHALVCRGKVHVAIDASMKPWDIAALVPCIEEAGGVVTSLAGDRSAVLTGGNLISSAHRELHDEVLSVLRG